MTRDLLRLLLVIASVILGFEQPVAGVTVIVRSADSGGDTPCQTYLRRANDDHEVVFPCGVPTQVQEGSYLGWIESKQRGSPFLTRVDLTKREAGHVHQLRWQMENTGAVVVSVPLPVNHVRLFSLRRDSNPDRLPFWRTLRVAEFGSRVSMPFGDAFALAFNADNEVVAVSRPFLIGPEKPTLVNVTLANSSNLVAFLDVSGKPSLSLTAGLEVFLTGINRREPEVVLFGGEKVTAVWYGVDERRVTVSANSTHGWLAPLEVAVHRDRPTTVRGLLRPLPSLAVSVLQTDHTEATGKMQLFLRRRGKREILRAVKIEAGDSVDIIDLPPEELEATLEVGPGRFSQIANLMSGRNESLTWVLTPLILQGQVTYGSEKARAIIKFMVPGSFQVESNEDGQYRAVLWQPGRYGLQITLPDLDNVPPFQEVVRLQRSRSFDIRIPRNVIRISTIDASDGKPIAGALVHSKNRSYSEEEKDNRGFLATVTTDDDGKAVLPPIRPGELQIRAVAAGYRDAEPLTITIEPDVEERQFELKLSRTGEPTVRILLPNGSPASGAEVIVADATSGRVLSSAEADSDGGVDLGQAGGDLLIVRHPSAASDVAKAVEVLKKKVWQLRVPGPPLEVTVIDGTQTRISGAIVTLLWGDVRVFGTALAALSGFAPVSAVGGKWIWLRPPAERLRFIATRTTAPQLVGAGLFDSLATEISFPWPAEPVVHVVD